ncbi:MAG: type II toxin-antitoxin system PemK/MazF family toxin [Bacillota bacterium]
MTGFNPGDVILVPFPFSDLSGAKKRPALVLAVIPQWRELVCVMLTSLPKGQSEVVVGQWESAGLLMPTVARVHRLFTIKATLVLGTLGKLDQEDFQKILGAVVAVLTKGRS